MKYKLRRKRLPILANFLFTSDVIPSDDLPPSTSPLAPVPRSHPPPLCYLPVILTPAQEAFISRRKAEVSVIVKFISLVFSLISNILSRSLRQQNRNGVASMKNEQLELKKLIEPVSGSLKKMLHAKI